MRPGAMDSAGATGRHGQPGDGLLRGKPLRRHLRPHPAHTVLGQPDLRPSAHSPLDSRAFGRLPTLPTAPTTAVWIKKEESGISLGDRPQYPNDNGEI